MNYCPCYSDVLLQHVRRGETYWFCRNCWQEMPVLGVSRRRISPSANSCKLPRLVKVKAQKKLEEIYACA